MIGRAVATVTALIAFGALGCGDESDGSAPGAAGANEAVGGTTPGTGGVPGGAGTGGAPGGGGTGGVPGGAGGTGSAATYPDCRAPCLMELLTRCRPTTSCIETPTDNRGLIKCEPETGWRSEYDPTGEVTRTVTINGEVCYTAVSDILATGTRESTYYSADQEVLAIVIHDSDGEWGRCPTLEPAGSEPVLYPHDREDPRCAMMECTPGVCD